MGRGENFKGTQLQTLRKVQFLFHTVVNFQGMISLFLSLSLSLTHTHTHTHTHAHIYIYTYNDIKQKVNISSVMKQKCTSYTKYKKN